MTTGFDDAILLSEEDEHLLSTLDDLATAMHALPDGAAALRASFQETLAGWLASYTGPMDPGTAWSLLLKGWGVDGLRAAIQARPGCTLHKLLARGLDSGLRNAHTYALLALSEDEWNSLLAMGFSVKKLFQHKEHHRALLEAGLTGGNPWMLDAWAIAFPKANPLFGYWRARSMLALPNAPLCDQALPQAIAAATAITAQSAPTDIMDRMVHYGLDERLWAVVARMAHDNGDLRRPLHNIAFGCSGDKKALTKLMGDAKTAHAQIALTARLQQLEDCAQAFRMERRPRPGSTGLTMEDFFPEV